MSTWSEIGENRKPARDDPNYEHLGILRINKKDSLLEFYGPGFCYSVVISANGRITEDQAQGLVKDIILIQAKKLLQGVQYGKES